MGPHRLDALFHGRIDFLMIRPGAEKAPQHADPFSLEPLRIEIRCIGSRDLAHRPGRNRIRGIIAGNRIENRYGIRDGSGQGAGRILRE